MVDGGYDRQLSFNCGFMVESMCVYPSARNVYYDQLSFSDNEVSAPMSIHVL